MDQHCRPRMPRNRLWCLGIVTLAAMLTAASAPRYDWSTADLSYVGGVAALRGAAASRALCARLIALRPPPADIADTRQAKALERCSSEALLYGIGHPADPVAARRCAWREYAIAQSDDGPPLDYFRGAGILAVAYANGWGGPRDMDMAIHMACGIDDAPAAMQARIDHLRALARNGPGRKPFRICDDISSGMSGGVCAAHAASFRDQDRAHIVARWKRSWSPARRAAFDTVLASMTAYAEAAHTLDCHGGTAATQCTIDGVESDLTRFTAKIGALLGQNPSPAVPPLAERSNAATDAAGWAQFMRQLPPDERALYETNGHQTIAARARFERDLLAFTATIPGITPHQTRQLFSDL
ncbi:hypothetical protein [uncultured Sphingomonas sp.]|uniref:hypothetical protein n=1 Tax=uncultured Sphingomonas sp. TaxID=158754 RepID=UPI0025EBF4FE|nr:hypothetical protein [uncultured Sphingomonas sp.]